MNIYRPLKAIRLNCLDCCCGSSNEVKLCPCEDCPLWPYRFGHRPSNSMIEKADFSEVNINTRDYSKNKIPWRTSRETAKSDEMEGNNE